MRTRFFWAGLRWVVFLPVSCCGVALAPGAAASAYADAGAANGAISGGFFADNSFLAVMPGGIPGSAKLRAGTEICGNAVANASANQKLPPGLLNAIAVVESGRLDPHTGLMKPWPWTIDANGTGYVYDSAQSAIHAAAGFEAAGITSLDVGCLQVNLAQHPDAFQTLAQAFDPAANADYASSFLTSLEQKFGNWPQAVAAYHSQTPALGEPYAAKVYAAWQMPNAAPVAPAVVASRDEAPSPMTAAMPPAFDMSLQAPPTAILMRPDKGFSGRNLAAYRAAPIAIATSLMPQG